MPVTEVNGAVGFSKVVRQIFTATGTSTYTPTPGMVYADVECQAAGGASGSALQTTAGWQTSSGGGAGGEYRRSLLTAVQVGASQTVTVGVGGTAAAAGNNNGNAGGDSSFGSLVVAKGGGGGGGAGATTAGGSGTAVTTGTGDEKVTGQNGGIGLAYNSVLFLTVSNDGGNAYKGFGGKGTTLTNAGQPGTVYGGGAGSVGTFNASASIAGAAGANGIVIVTEYIK